MGLKERAVSRQAATCIIYSAIITNNSSIVVIIAMTMLTVSNIFTHLILIIMLTGRYRSAFYQ